ncbi:VOC family protein [Planococcus lenghuensis]|uniref:Glyoxalase n=1 Tax=Planococcus lenghuensis TaxID=2213202 RepID=A0A1Q2L1U3_9BACL|nr:VOC family protein [Planococcus lenghuensis]AQQ54409.1 glyoxalase [Planococcus lenghuensis]
MRFLIERIDHVQVAAPKGEEEAARSFYSGVLGMEEVEKPGALKARGGAWFKSGSCQLHVGMEDPFMPAKKAHPAFLVEGYDELREYLTSKGVEFQDDDNIPGVVRMYVSDPFGNRIELMKG